MKNDPNKQRGVYVSPPSADTYVDLRAPMLIRSGFDTLELSYRANIPDDFLNLLESNKLAAILSKKPVVCRHNGREFLVSPFGGQGGYQYLIDCGEFEAIWKFKCNSQNDPWNVHCKLRSYGLATRGLIESKQNADAFLSSIGFLFDQMDARIGRVDFAVDVHAPGLQPILEHFVCHACTKKGVTVNLHSSGDQTKGVQLGTMPGWQVAIYNKSKEVREKKKRIWAQILRKSAASLTLPELKNSSQSSIEVPDDIWRIEGRAGRDAIDQLVKPRRWDAFLKSIDELPQFLAKRIRWCIPTNDSNRARWPLHPAWEIFLKEISTGMRDFPTTEVPLEALREIRAEAQRTLENQVAGTMLSLAALDGVARSDLKDYLAMLSVNLFGRILSDPKLADKLDEKTDRLKFMYGI